MTIAWFSCGATSAVACKIALQMYDDVRVVYIETGSGHPDNERFLKDCERWYMRTNKDSITILIYDHKEK